MVALRKTTGLQLLMTLIAAVAIAFTGTAVGLAAASLANGASEDHGIQLVRPFHIAPEVDRANHDEANH